MVEPPVEPPWIDITYPGPDIPMQQAVGVPIAVLKWWTALKVEMQGKRPLCALPGTHGLISL